jgi:ribosome-binding factor A
METTRQQKVARLIQKELAAILQTEGSYLCGMALVTITRINVSKDFSVAHVYLSIFKADDTQKVLKAIETNKKELRFKLGQRVKHQLRIIPELIFVLDDTLDYIEHINNLLYS